MRPAILTITAVAGLVVTASSSCDPLPAPQPSILQPGDFGQDSGADVYTFALPTEPTRMYVLPPGARSWAIVRNGDRFALEWGEQDPEFSLMRVDLPIRPDAQPIGRFHHPTNWASATQWLQMKAGQTTTSVALLEGISLERFGDEYGALFPDGGFAWYGRCENPDQPRISDGDRDGEAWFGSGVDCFRSCPGIHQMSLWRITEPGDGGFAPICLFSELSGPKGLVLHAHRRLGAALLYPVYPGPRVIRLFEFDESGVTNVAPDIPLSDASARFWPVGRRLLFPVMNPSGSSSDPKTVRQIEWIGDQVVTQERPDLGALFRDLRQYARLDEARVLVVGDALDATPLTPVRLVALLANDAIVGTTTVPRGSNSRYAFHQIDERVLAFWEVRVDDGDGGTSKELWGQELVFAPAEAGDAGVDGP